MRTYKNFNPLLDLSFFLTKTQLRKFGISQEARVTDLEKRERDLVAQRHTLNDQYNQAKQEAAVAKKEIDMLREAMPLKAKHK